MEEIKLQKEYIEKIKQLNYKNLHYFILTMGCKLNENDSEKIEGMLEQMNYKKTEELKEADIVIINTCCIRENAEEKVFGKLGELKKQKQEKDTIIAIGGCMMQQEHIVTKLKKSYPYIDIIFGTHTLHKLPQNLYQVLTQKMKIQDIENIDGQVYEGLPIKRQNANQASVTIMYGCNNFCSYCIVPYVRGRERSREPHYILEEIKQLAKEGTIEITLLGQNVNSYLKSEQWKELGKEECGVNSFATLLRAINKIEGIQRIRFISPHPKDFTDDVIEAIRDCEKVCKLIHLPLQSGSSKVLKEMNRKYTQQDFLTLVKKMREQIPNVTFSTDIIVGFPGETEKDFAETLEVVKKVNFEQIYMFIYSRRKGTVADKMENQIPEEIKHQRFNQLKELFESNITNNNQKYIGTIQKVLVEGISKSNEQMYTGRTDSNKIVNFKGNKQMIGKIIDIKITKEHMWYLEGEVV